jgi:hypothetical protein
VATPDAQGTRRRLTSWKRTNILDIRPRMFRPHVADQHSELADVRAFP